MARKVLILGGGPGGVVAANKLLEYGQGLVEVTLVEKTGKHAYPPSFLWIMTGNREIGDVVRPLDPLARKGVRIVKASVEEIDPEGQKVKVTGGELEYDYLVVALGSRPDLEPLRGKEKVCTPWTAEGAMDCRRKLAALRGGGRIVAGPLGWPYKCPPAPFEVAFLAKYVMEQRGLGSKTSVSVVHFWKKPMEPFGPLMQDAFLKFMGMYGIGYTGGFEVDRVEDGRLVSKNGDTVEFDLAIMTPVYLPPEPVANSRLANPDAGGYMRVELSTLRHPDYPNVFGVGDVIAPSIGLGMAGVFAHFQAEYVASQIVDEVKGTFMGEHYNMSGVCVMDLGYAGAAVYCDFSQKLQGRAEYPDCVMLGGMKAFRAVKAAFERYWFERWL